MYTYMYATLLKNRFHALRTAPSSLVDDVREHNLSRSGSWALYAAFALSVINLVLWSYNLFVFLLLRVLPIYFDKIKTPPVDMAYTIVPIPKTNAN